MAYSLVLVLEALKIHKNEQTRGNSPKQKALRPNQTLGRKNTWEHKEVAEVNASSLIQQS